MLRLASKVAGLSRMTFIDCSLFSRHRPPEPPSLGQRKVNQRIADQSQKIADIRNRIKVVKNNDFKIFLTIQEEQKSKQKEQEAAGQKMQMPEAQSSRMFWIIAGALGMLVLLQGNLEESASLGTETNEVDFYNRLAAKQFISLKVVRRLKKPEDQEKKAEWITNLLGISNSTTYMLPVHNLRETLKRLDELNIPVEFEHRASKSSALRPTNSRYMTEALLFGGVLFLMLRFNGVWKGNMNDITSKLRGKPFKPTALTVKTQFKDVAGLQEAKHEITEFVDFLKKPEKFTDMGAKIPRGALLTGPPGTGKTMLAKACAGEAGVPFFYISGSEFVEKFVGVGASRVRSLFESATKKAPSIIFIDEIDAIGKKRGTGPRTNEERVSTLNQLLVNMDGFGTDSKVVVLAATNRKDMLDPALLRPGRFDRIIEVTLPDLEGRYEILCVHLDKVRFDPSLTKENLARRLSSITPGFSGADLSNICNEAAILAARADQAFVTMSDFEKATERVLAGLEKRNNLTGEEKRIIAYHESGRAIASWFLEGGDPLIKLTIIPRSKKSLGYSQFLPDQISLYTKEELLDKICCALAGKVAEELTLNQITDSSTADLQKARKIANAIVTRYGMSDVVSSIGYPQNEMIKKPYSSTLQEKIDDEIFRIISRETQRVRELLKANIDKLHRLAETVLQKETLDLDAIKEILGERPFAARSNFKAYLSLTKPEPTPPEKITEAS